MKKTASTLILLMLSASAALSACGRNQGANPGVYSGTGKIEAEWVAARPNCVQFDLSRMSGEAIITGKEKFKTDRKGVFKLDSYQISMSSDRTDHTAPNSVFLVTEFDDLSGAAPRLAIKTECIDTKGKAQTLAVSPVTQIDSTTGLVLQAQPFNLWADSKGEVSAESQAPTLSAQALPAGEVPEVALLLGAQYQENFKTLSFKIDDTEDGSLRINAEIVGVDAKLTRLYIRVDAVYTWDSAE